jgi:hypothetical protein
MDQTTAVILIICAFATSLGLLAAASDQAVGWWEERFPERQPFEPETEAAIEQAIEVTR